MPPERKRIYKIVPNRTNPELFHITAKVQADKELTRLTTMIRSHHI